MAGSKTTYLAQKTLDHNLGGAAYTRPGTVYLVLSMAAFDATATGSACNEVAAVGYARLSLPNSGATWSAATLAWPSEKHNLNDLLFPSATTSWGTPLSAYLADAATAGNVLYGSDITNPQPVGIGDIAKIQASGFSFQES